MKVAQYEVLGNDAKKRCPSRKGRSKHSAFGLAHGSAIVSIRRSSRPGWITLLKTLTQHFVLARQVPTGLIFSNHQTNLRDSGRDSLS